jgi:hypothetical protein
LTQHTRRRLPRQETSAIYRSARNRKRRRTAIVSAALAILALLLRPPPLTLAPAAAAADRLASAAHALCLAEAGGGAGPRAPSDNAPGPSGHNCLACCVASTGAAATPPPSLNVERVAYAEPFVPAPAAAGGVRCFFAHSIRARAPPAGAQA